MSTWVPTQLDRSQSKPPSTRTVPFVSNVAAWSPRAVFRLPVRAKVPKLRLYNSALARILLLVSSPPAIRTFPPFNSEALPQTRATFQLPLDLHNSFFEP